MQLCEIQINAKMDSIRIKNLHCLADTGEIPLRPINILVGANSSGKSSFLRLFPLIKQGLNTNKRGPFLWLSEDVDFGDFKTAVKKGEKNIEIEFGVACYKIIINIIDGSPNDYISYLQVTFYDQKIRINITSKGEVECITINDESFYKDDFCLSDDRNRILPTFIFKDPSKRRMRTILSIYQSFRLDEDLLSFIKKVVSGRLSPKTIQDIRDKILKAKSLDKVSILNNIKAINKPKMWNSIVSEWDITDKDFLSLNNRIVLSFAFIIIDNLDRKLTRYFYDVNYIGPFRATAERYYRRQNLALNTLDSRGMNLPMLINELKDKDKQELKEWMSKHFNFYLDSDYSSGHIALSIISLSTNDRINLADSGFGFSQVIPIIIFLWLLTGQRMPRRRVALNYFDISYFIIEQPELHLHPAFQAKLADVFISAIDLAKKNNIELKIILETHSEAIINRIGERVYDKRISKEDVTVALFEKSVNSSGKNVTLSNFTDEGALENWPIGFFNAD